MTATPANVVKLDRTGASAAETPAAAMQRDHEAQLPETAAGSSQLLDPKCAVLRLTIEDVEPPIWRRVVVPRDWRLGDLHRVAQAAFGWSGVGTYEFILAGLSFSSCPTSANVDTSSRIYDEGAVRIRDMVGRDVEFSYQIGEYWLVAIVLEDLLWNEPGSDVAYCVGGERASPPEYVAGPEAYAAMLTRHQRPFDLAAANRRVALVAPAE